MDEMKIIIEPYIGIINRNKQVLKKKKSESGA